jgi:hypothetical protein
MRREDSDSVPEHTNTRDSAPGAEPAPGRASGSEDPAGTDRPALRLPLLSEGKQVGLGEVIERATTALHLRPCAGCHRRAAYLNARVVFTPRRPRR